MNIPFSPRELEAIARYAKLKDMPEEALVRYALRLFDLYERSDKTSWTDDKGNIVTRFEIVLPKSGGCMGD